MSIVEFIKSVPRELIDVGKPISRYDIAMSEAALKVTFHPELYEYLENFGWIGIGSWQLFGISNIIKSVADQPIVRESVDFRRSSGLNDIAISHDGGDCFIVFEVLPSGMVNPIISMKTFYGVREDWVSNGLTLTEWFKAILYEK